MVAATHRHTATCSFVVLRLDSSQQLQLCLELINEGLLAVVELLVLAQVALDHPQRLHQGILPLRPTCAQLTHKPVKLSSRAALGVGALWLACPCTVLLENAALQLQQVHLLLQVGHICRVRPLRGRLRSLPGAW